jgi:hypothetical protein
MPIDIDGNAILLGVMHHAVAEGCEIRKEMRDVERAACGTYEEQAVVGEFHA